MQLLYRAGIQGLQENRRELNDEIQTLKQNREELKNEIRTLRMDNEELNKEITTAQKARRSAAHRTLARRSLRTDYPGLSCLHPDLPKQVDHRVAPGLPAFVALVVPSK